MKKIALALALAAAGNLGVGSVSAAELLIDHFSVGTGFVQDTIDPIPPAPFPSLNILGDGDAIGGSRTIAIVPGGTQNGTFAAVNRSPNFNQFFQDQGTGSSGTTTITWDKNGAAGGLGGVDLTLGGTNDALQVNITSIDQGMVTLTFDIVDSTAGARQLTLPGLSVGAQPFLFTAFTGTGNFTSVNSIKLTIAAGVASDVGLDLVQTRSVPVPATLALLGLGLMGVRLRRRKAA